MLIINMSIACYKHVTSLFISFTILGALFAAVAAVETVCTLLGAVIFNCLYPVTMHFGFSGFIFLTMALLLLAPLTIIQ